MMKLCPCASCLSTDLEHDGLKIECNRCGNAFDYSYSPYERSVLAATGSKGRTEKQRASDVVRDWNDEF